MFYHLRIHSEYPYRGSRRSRGIVRARAWYGAGLGIVIKKRTAIALADGAARASQGQPRRCRSRQRIDVMAIGWRLGEFLGADQAYEYTRGTDTNTAREIQSIWHDIRSANHERDYQALGLPLLPSIWKYLAIAVAVVGIQAGGAAMFHSYTACPIANKAQI